MSGIPTIYSTHLIILISITKNDQEQTLCGCNTLPVECRLLMLGLNLPRMFKKRFIAGQYRFNVVGYDFQVLGGYYHERITAGAGLAGNIGTAGLKAEGTYFGENDSISASFSGAMDVQYGFRNGINLIFSYLYNSAGSNELVLDGDGLSVFSELSADNLMPSMHSAFGDISYTFNPLITADLGMIYTFGYDMFFIMPNFTYSIKENLDLNVLAQVFVAFVDLGGITHTKQLCIYPV